MLNKKTKLSKIITKKAPLPIGSYSQAIAFENIIFCSGQIGIDPKTNELVQGLENQVHQIMLNLKAVLEAANSDFTKVVKTTIFLTSINDFPKVNEIYSKYFKNSYPARSTVEVKNLPKGALVEIELIAIK